MKLSQVFKVVLCVVLASAALMSFQPQALGQGATDANQAKDPLDTIIRVGKIQAGTALALAMRIVLGPLAPKSDADPGVKYQLADDTISMPVPALELGEMSAKEALTKVLDAAGAQYTVDCSSPCHRLSITRKPSDDWQRPVFIEFSGMPLEMALETLLKGTGRNYVISPDLSKLTINATLKNVPVEVALRAILRAAGATYRIEGDVVMVSRQSQLSANQPQAAPLQAMPVVGQDTAPVLNYGAMAFTGNQDKVVSKTVQFSNVNASDMTSVIAQPGLEIKTTSNNQSIITGPETQVDQAVGIISALDQKQTLPRPLRVRLETRITGTDGKQPIVANSWTENVGAEGTMIPLQIQINEGGSSTQLQANVIPTVEKDGRITAAASGILNWSYLGSSRIVKVFSDVATSMVQGRPQIITSGSSNVGKSVTTFEIALTAVVEEGRLRLPSMPGEMNPGVIGVPPAPSRSSRPVITKPSVRKAPSSAAPAKK